MLENRVRALPLALRCLRRWERGVYEAQERSDHLLADLEVHLCERLRRPGDTLDWLDDAERVLHLKRATYGLMDVFLRREGESAGVLRGYRRAALHDLALGRRRLERVRATWRPARPVWP